MPNGYTIGPTGEWIPIGNPTATSQEPIYSAPVQQTPANNASLIGSLRSQIQQGQIDPSVAVQQLTQSLPPFQSNETWSAYQARVASATQSLLSNLGTIRTTDGQYGTVNPNTAQVTRTSTPVNTSNTSISGGTSSSSQAVQGSMPLKYDSKTGQPTTNYDVSASGIVTARPVTNGTGGPMPMRYDSTTGQPTTNYDIGSDGRVIARSTSSATGGNIQTVSPGQTIYDSQTGKQITGSYTVSPNGLVTAVTSPASSALAGLEQLARTDPFIADMLSDPSQRSLLESMASQPELLQSFISQSKLLKQSIESGKVINPNIDVNDPAFLQQFIDKSHALLDPYYAEQMGFIKKDIDTALTRLADDYTKGITRAEQPFKDTLATNANNEAESGTAFSSGRVKRENQAVTDQQNKLDDLTETSVRAGQDALNTAERKIGSAAFGGSTIPGLNTYSASTSGFAPLGTRTINLSGGLAGSMPNEQKTNVDVKARQLQSDYLTKQAITSRAYNV